MKLTLILALILLSGCGRTILSVREEIQPNLFKVREETCNEAWQHVRRLLRDRHEYRVTIVDVVVADNNCKYLVEIGD